jgi:hypothetical protein
VWSLGCDHRLRSEFGRRYDADPAVYSCFISYSSEDEEFCQRLHNDLQAAGVRCWFAPEDLKIGDRFHDEIEGAIRRHDKLLLVLTETSVGSDWVRTEVESALERKHRERKEVLFPVCLDDAIKRRRKPGPQTFADSGIWATSRGGRTTISTSGRSIGCCAICGRTRQTLEASSARDPKDTFPRSDGVDGRFVAQERVTGIHAQPS